MLLPHRTFQVAKIGFSRATAARLEDHHQLPAIVQASFDFQPPPRLSKPSICSQAMSRAARLAPEVNRYVHLSFNALRRHELELATEPSSSRTSATTYLRTSSSTSLASLDQCGTFPPTPGYSELLLHRAVF